MARRPMARTKIDSWATPEAGRVIVGCGDVEELDELLELDELEDEPEAGVAVADEMLEPDDVGVGVFVGVLLGEATLAPPVPDWPVGVGVFVALTIIISVGVGDNELEVLVPVGVPLR